jgi:hypothetical protein
MTSSLATRRPSSPRVEWLLIPPTAGAPAVFFREETLVPLFSPSASSWITDSLGPVECLQL